MMWCDTLENGLAHGQVQVGLVDGDLGVAQALCPQNRLGLAVGGGAIVETTNFYGHIVGSGTLRGTLAVSKRTALYASIEGFRYDAVIAPIASSAIGLGYTDVGASGQVVQTERFALAVQGKLVLPTAFTLNQNGWPLAGDLGLAAGWSPTEKVVVHGSVLGLGGLGLGGGPLFPHAGANVNTGLEWRATHGFGVVFDALGGFGYTAPVDVLAAGVGLRGAVGEHAGLALEATVPLAGRERTLAAFDLRFDWRL
jgi:hypothetical protein